MNKNQVTYAKNSVINQTLEANDLAFNIKKSSAIKNSVIKNINSYIPKHKFNTKEVISKIGHKFSDKLKSQLLEMDIQERYVACDMNKFLNENIFELTETNTGMSIKAVNELIFKSDFDIKEIDHLITSTETDDYISPGLSNVLIAECGFRNDIRHVSVAGMGCASIITLLGIAQDYIAIRPQAKVMILMSVLSSSFYQNIFDVDKFYTIEEIRKDESLSKNKEYHINNWLSIIQMFLFSDSASAMIITGDDVPGSDSGFKLIKNYHLSNISKNDYKLAYFYHDKNKMKFHMDKKLPAKGLIYTKKLLQEIPAELKENIDAWIIHTGSKKIIDSVVSGCNIPYKKAKISYDILNSYGNLSLCSLSMGLEILQRRNFVAKGKLIGVIGFGNGFSANISILENK
jgi:predicted naringenin-chalcone synthase